MSTTFANSINSNPIYADRAEKDAAGNTISTTYATKSEIPTVPTIVGLTAGANVSITESNNAITIAATDTTYSAGTGIDITSGSISVDTTTVAMKTDIPTVPSAGNMLSTTNNVLNVTTTAGITDIQLVQSMPASPVATVLYLIPEA